MCHSSIEVNTWQTMVGEGVLLRHLGNRRKQKRGRCLLFHHHSSSTVGKLPVLLLTITNQPSTQANSSVHMSTTNIFPAEGGTAAEIAKGARRLASEFQEVTKQPVVPAQDNVVDLQLATCRKIREVSGNKLPY